MRQITEIAPDLYHVISEPNDGTRYDFFVFQMYDDFVFMPCKSTFRFPQRLNYYNIPDSVLASDYTELARQEQCNVYTLIECCKVLRTIRVG